ncbi:methyltransferase [Spirochaetia bacterium]|nr:methyltransferase [Spirochaetia bacterium]
MEQYWNERFRKEKFIWGTEPGDITKSCEKIFRQNNTKTILIPGIGYGRNGKYFSDKGYSVDGIEISEEAIKTGKAFVPKINFIQGSVLDMETGKKYDAVFCYDILHLFKKDDRKKALENCIKHIKTDGMIVVSCFSTEDKTYGKGTMVEENTYEVKKDKTVHFYGVEELRNIHEKLIPIRIDHSTEKIKTDSREDEYDIIYGVFKLRP